MSWLRVYSRVLVRTRSKRFGDHAELEVWVTWSRAGPLEEVALDPAPRFLEGFHTEDERSDIDLEYNASETHWQLGWEDGYDSAYDECFENISNDTHVRIWMPTSQTDRSQCGAECARRTRRCTRICVRPLGRHQNETEGNRVDVLERSRVIRVRQGKIESPQKMNVYSKTPRKDVIPSGGGIISTKWVDTPKEIFVAAETQRPSRPRCTCRCGCRVRPGRRRQCPVCGAMVGPGCHPTPCWDQNMGCCHMCVGGNPQESYEKLAEEMHVRTFAFLSDVDRVRCAAECFRPSQLCSGACARPLGHMDLLPRWQDAKI